MTGLIHRFALQQGLASYCKAETTFTFYFTILPLSRAFLSINNREMKSESGFSFAMASQPFQLLACGLGLTCHGTSGIRYAKNMYFLKERAEEK